MVLMNRMLFSNTTIYSAPQGQPQSSPARTYVKPAALNAKMIDRGHRARSGCSACGKTVM